jgi:hypothetical protein
MKENNRETHAILGEKAELADIYVRITSTFSQE